MSNAVWSSAITEELVSHLDEAEIESLVDELNDAVAAICEDYGV